MIIRMIIIGRFLSYIGLTIFSLFFYFQTIVPKDDTFSTCI